MGFTWPAGFTRVPDDEWTKAPIEGLALKYDTVEHHGWYSNLDPTLADLLANLRDGDLLLDYSGGTGILAERLLGALGARPVGVVIVDASPKFLRLAHEKLGADARVAFRLLRYLKDRKRLELVEEVVGPDLVARGFDALTSTNAIHLYYGLSETLASWRRALRPGGRAFIQSGNIRNPSMPDGEWIIDETVEAIHHAALSLVRDGQVPTPWREALLDAAHQEKYGEVRRKYFLPVRPLSYYLDALAEAELAVMDVTRSSIECRVDEWREFLAVYHEGVLGWYRDPAAPAGDPPGEEVVAARLALLKQAMEQVFAGGETFRASWTYVTAERPPGGLATETVPG